MAVAFDVVGPSSSGKIGSASPVTWAHNPGATGDALLVFVGLDEATSGTTCSATFNGVSMTQLGSVNVGNASNGFIYLFGLANVSSGSQTVSVTFSGSTDDLYGASLSFSGAAPTTGGAFGTFQHSFGSSAAPSLGFTTTSASNQLAAFAGMFNGSGSSLSSGATSRFVCQAVSAGDVGSIVGGNAAGTGGTVTVTFSQTGSAPYGICGVEVLPAPPASGSTYHAPLFPPGRQSPAAWSPLDTAQASVPMANAYDQTGALGTGDAGQPAAAVTGIDQTGAPGTGAAYSPAGQVTALPAAATGTGTAYSPVAAVTALPAAAPGTGAAFLPGWGPGTVLATGTGTAYSPVAQVTGLPAAAPGTGTAYSPVAQVTGLPAAAPGTGTAYNPVAQVTGLPAAAPGTGTAYNPAAQVTGLPAAAPGTGTAFAPFISYTAGTAPGTGAAYNPAAQVTGLPAAAAGTGTAYSPAAQVTGLPAACPGTGAAYLPGWGPVAGLASGTGSALSPPTGRAPGAASGTGAALLPGWGPVPATATATAVAIFNISTTAFPGAALGTGDAFLPGWGPADLTGALASGDTGQVTPAVTGTDQTGALGTGAAGQATMGFGAGAALAEADVFQPDLGWGPVTALGTAAAGKPGWGPVTASAAGGGTAYSPALIQVTAFPASAPATGTAYGPVELSPALEAYGFGTFPQVPAGAIILAVVANIVWSGSDAGIQAPAYELWDGTSARIAAVDGVASVTAGHRDSVVFTGVVYSQLATLRLRIYAASLLGNAGATASFDAVSLSVTWAPNTNAAAAPAALRVVPAFPAVSVSNGITAAPAPALATGTACQAVAEGFINATAAPAALAVVPVFPEVRIGIGQTVSPGVLAVVPVFPAIPDITGPGWAASDDQPVSGTGSWANPGNITGPPDGSNAVWTAV